MMQMLDLFSGLGGASEAFLQNGWNVIRIDNNPMFGPGGKYAVPWTITSDVKNLKKTFETKTIHFLWASPPCKEFSLAYSSPRSKASREGQEYEPDMTLIHETVRVIKEVQPRYWCVENVLGASKYISKVLGPHRIKLGSAMLWGNFPIIGLHALETKYKQKIGDKNRRHELRANLKAKIPYWMSEQMRISVQYQMTLDDFAESLPQSRG